jgi:tetratricopeptide (TPR) repeat protein
MKRVDSMLAYLSGEMDREEAARFEQELAEDRELRESYRQVERAYRLMAEQLKRKDEEAFQEALRKAMGPMPVPSSGRKGIRRPGWYVLAALAAGFTLLVVILLTGRGNSSLYSSFFHPEQDPVILAFSPETRGQESTAILHYYRGDFRTCLELTGARLREDPEDSSALLFHLLSALHLDEEGEALLLVENAQTGMQSTLGRTLAWYRALALVKNGREDEAIRVLGQLLEDPGPYERDAHKLQARLKK